MDPRLSWLTSFVAVAEELHFGRAADRLHLSTSAVSRHVRSLEDEFGAPLFDRTSRSVRLTPSGRSLYGEIAVPVAALRSAFVRGDGAAAGLCVAYVSAPGERMVPEAAARFGADPLALPLRLLPASSSEQRIGLLDGRVDVGIQWVLPGSPAPADLEMTPIRNEPLVAALHLEHPYASSSGLRLVDLAGEYWLMAVDSSDLVVRQGLIAACQRAGFLPRIRSEANGFKAQLSLVAADRGICFAPAVARDYGDFEVAYVPVHDLSVDLVAVTRPAPDRHLRRFIELLRAIA
ncbi:LysR family transcriptional regulator [Jiangella alkaliphila]|uniref:DNA-binding transcriptional regulator, LysR family n=1 Tax=Jiangella alkaliphila TaxID=419479 RepID=A0A1H2LKY5_9ACTN|nr:LysR substrate-binding domain-containing protein [Jiangella alkaliphila]SDU81231.1 DNA-binding transcriptional regulator, LysR family [Jiangella alkaliphila]